MFDKMIAKAHDMLYAHPWTVLVMLATVWTFALSLAYVADSTTGVVKFVAMLIAVMVMFPGTDCIGALNISARYERKANNR